MFFRLIEYHRTILSSGTTVTLFALGEVLFFNTHLAAAAFVFFYTLFTLDEKQVAPVILTVGMVIAWLAALMTLRYYLFSDTFASSYPWPWTC